MLAYDANTDKRPTEFDASEHLATPSYMEKEMGQAVQAIRVQGEPVVDQQ